MKKIILFSLFLFIFLPLQADAARFFLVSDAPEEVGVGDEWVVDIMIDSEDVSINAAQAQFHYSNNLFSITDVSRIGSIFNFWVEDPTYSNDEGILSFIGGTAKGVSGESLQVLSVTVKAIGVGVGTQTFVDAVIAASDGKGTNVLSTIESVNIAVGTRVVGREPSTIEEVAQPIRIVRDEVIKGTELPEAPELTVALYPDSERWYNKIGDVIVLWEVPNDVIKVAIEVDQNPNTEPPVAEEELFNGKNIGALSDGIWYIHVQYRNNVGWGDVGHYKVSIDTVSPIQFEIKTDDEVTDNPTPEIRFDTQDSLSGIAETIILIDGAVFGVVEESPFKLPVLSPGPHIVTVRFFDKAGNSIEDSTAFEILPLSTPKIGFVTKTISQDERIFMSGTSDGSTFVDIRLHNFSGKEVFVGEAIVDNSGAWEKFIDDEFPTGKYTVTAVARDERGATSYVSEQVGVRIKGRPVLSLGFIDIGWFELFLILIIIVLGGSGGAYFLYYKAQETRGAYATITARDIEKLETLIENDLKTLDELLNAKKLDEGAMGAIIEQMRSKLNVMKSSIDKQLKKIK